jgi:transposase
MRIGVGIDWGSQEHEVCIYQEGAVRGQHRRVRHDGSDIDRLYDELSTLTANRADVYVAIEMPHGPLVDAALDRGFSVFSINPRQVDRFRDRFFNSGKKDDKADSYVLARTVLTDNQCYRRLALGQPEYVSLREWSRERETLVQDRTRLVNRITGLFRRYYPQFLETGAVDTTFAAALFKLVPTPERATRTQLRSLEKVLQEHRIRRIRAEQVKGILARRPLFVGAHLVEALAARLQLAYEQLELVDQQLATCENHITKIVTKLHEEQKKKTPDEPSDIEIWTSLDGVGKVVLGTLLAEAQLLIQQAELGALRALCGCAPVTKNTGQRENKYAPRSNSIVHMRRACSQSLRNAVYHLGRCAAVFSPKYKARYAEMRGRGHSHGRACRQIADQLLRVALAMLRTRTLFDRQHGQPTHMQKHATGQEGI